MNRHTLPSLHVENVNAAMPQDSLVMHSHLIPLRLNSTHLNSDLKLACKHLHILSRLFYNGTSSTSSCFVLQGEVEDFVNNATSTIGGLQGQLLSGFGKDSPLSNPQIGSIVQDLIQLYISIGGL